MWYGCRFLWVGYGWVQSGFFSCFIGGVMGGV